MQICMSFFLLAKIFFEFVQSPRCIESWDSTHVNIARLSHAIRSERNPSRSSDMIHKNLIPISPLLVTPSIQLNIFLLSRVDYSNPKCKTCPDFLLPSVKEDQKRKCVCVCERERKRNKKAALAATQLFFFPFRFLTRLNRPLMGFIHSRPEKFKHPFGYSAHPNL